MIIWSLFFFLFWPLWYNYKQFEFKFHFNNHYITVCCLSEVEIPDVESLQFDLDTIEADTNKFSDDNKIGEAGFGAVYKVKF